MEFQQSTPSPAPYPLPACVNGIFQSFLLRTCQPPTNWHLSINVEGTQRSLLAWNSTNSPLWGRSGMYLRLLTFLGYWKSLSWIYLLFLCRQDAGSFEKFHQREMTIYIMWHTDLSGQPVITCQKDWSPRRKRKEGALSCYFQYPVEFNCRLWKTTALIWIFICYWASHMADGNQLCLSFYICVMGPVNKVPTS